MIVCELCGAVDNLLRCSRCRSAYYCCKEHQRQHWLRHKTVCATTTITSSPLAHHQNSGDIAGSPYGYASTYSSASSPNLDSSTFPTSPPAGYHDTGLPPVYYDLNSQTLRSDGGLALTTEVESPAWLAGVDHLRDELTSFFEEVPVITGANSRRSPDGATGYEAGGRGVGDFDESLAFLLDGLAVPAASGVAPTELERESAAAFERTVSVAPSAASSSSTPPHRPVNPRLQSMIGSVIRDMDRHGICVIDNFMGPETGTAILREVAAMYDTGAFEDGKVKSSPAGHASRNVRGDKILWVNGLEPTCRSIGALIRLVDAVVMSSNRTPNNGKLGQYDITDRTKAMVACYPGNGTQYVKHVDNPNRDGRCITSIYYLNRDWDVKKDGGLLRIFPKGWSMRVADIEPVFDRILFFWSDRRNPHEVQPANRTRYAITLWYYDKAEREYARRNHQQSSCPA